MAKKTPNKTGRPEKVNDEIIRKLEYAFSIGATVLEACCHADIPKSTYYDYLNKNPSFSDRVELLKEEMPLKAREVIKTDILSGDSHTAKWFLERNKRKEFSTQQNIEQKSDIEVTDNRDIEKYSIEDLEALSAIHGKYKDGEGA
jgi:hypothetical protein